MYSQECRSIEWQEIFNIVTTSTLAENTEKYRYYKSCKLEDDAQKIKKHMPAFTPAVICDGGRRPENFVCLTGVGMCDFDHVADVESARKTLTDDGHAMMVYKTISGNGLRVLFRYEVEGTRLTDKMTANEMSTIYGAAFRTGNEYFARLLGCEADGQCKNLGRLSVICHDAEATLNTSSEPIAIELPEKKAAAKKGTDRKYHTTLERAVRAVEKQLEREGVRYCKGSYNRYVSKAGYYLNRLGVNEDEATQWAVERFSDYDSTSVRAIMKSCFAHTAEHASMRVQKMEKSDANDRAKGVDITAIEKFLDEHAAFRFNVITRKTEYKTEGSDRWLEVTDRLENSLWSAMNKAGLHVRSIDLHNVILSDYVAEWNPFKEYFDNLPEWDGTTDHIGTLTAMVHVRKGDLWDDTEDPQGLFDMCFRKWLVAMVASLLDKEVVNNVIMVLIGRQGIYKTTFSTICCRRSCGRIFILRPTATR